MELFVLLEVMTDQVEWRFAIIIHGEQCVMISGVCRMLGWCADNLDYHRIVSICTDLLTTCPILEEGIHMGSSKFNERVYESKRLLRIMLFSVFFHCTRDVYM